MAESKASHNNEKEGDKLSDAASSHLEEHSLHDEPLPSYSNAAEQSSELHPQASTQPASNNLGPTTTSPFDFPTSANLPSYADAAKVRKPLAIPQICPTPDARFLSAYPPHLLSYGIAAESWYNFVETLSAFLSATVSGQAVHHATDIANNIGNYHKRYASRVKQDVKNIGKSAKHLNPFGVVGGAIGVTVGGVGHIVGSIFNVQGSVLSKPQKPRERAEVYLAAANKDWFHSRELHAFLLDTGELSRMLGISMQQFLATASREGDGNASRTLASLRPWISDLEIKDSESVNEGPTTDSSSETAQSKKAGKRPHKADFLLDASTLWLVIAQKEERNGTYTDEKLEKRQS